MGTQLRGLESRFESPKKTSFRDLEEPNRYAAVLYLVENRVSDYCGINVNFLDVIEDMNYKVES